MAMVAKTQGFTKSLLLESRRELVIAVRVAEILPAPALKGLGRAAAWRH